MYLVAMNLQGLGEDVYVDFREVPFQPDNLENPFTKFELSYKGGIVNSRNAKFISLDDEGLTICFSVYGSREPEG
jgi:hypothetical protein